MKYRYPWHAYYSVLLQAIRRECHAYDSKIELQAMELRLYHGNIFPKDQGGKNLVVAFKSQLQTVDEKNREDAALQHLKTASCTRTASFHVSHSRPKGKLPSTAMSVNVPHCSRNGTPSTTTIVVDDT